MTRQRVPRHRWHRPLRIAAIGFFCSIPWLFRSPLGGSLDKFIAVGAFAVALFLELIVKPRLELPGSRVCTRCDASSPPQARACVFCGRERLTDGGVLYPPYLAEIPAARVAHRRAIVALIVLGAATFIPMILYPSHVAMAGYFVVIYYTYDIITGAMLKRTHRALVEHAGGLCTHCTYPLVDSSPQCPECGIVGSVSDARRAWAASGLWHPDNAMAQRLHAKPDEPRASASGSH
jgi:RNA polymerase subunit RPABC4/transcription elongation factor Spt4